ncbi:Swi3-domain-containing protein [Xylaria sp. CBS 124048]|nr:Swi3-domain-containing protein [Xylaria sp. CBS 124048]
MTSLSARKSTAKPPNPPNQIDDYDLDDVVDPFGFNDTNQQSNKRKDATGLGIDEAVDVTKKPRVPRAKLDEKKLLSENGIPKLRRKAGSLKFKGKGHEFSDAARLLSFYQLWLDDLFPKAQFVDALGMVEKAGHKKHLQVKRMEWINEGRPRSPRQENDENDLFGESYRPEEQRDPAIFPAPLAPIFQNSVSGGRPKTPTREEMFPDEDIYDATPRRPKNTAPATSSLFGNGGNIGTGDEPNDDDLDALMAEEEAQRTAPTSIFGNGNGKTTRTQLEPDEDDLDALMAEAEAVSSTTRPAVSRGPRPGRKTIIDDEEDDLDAFMAEAEALGSNHSEQSSHGPGTNTKETATANHAVDEDEEVAMAEMDGLW